MSVKTYRPTTPSRRHMSVSGFDGIDKKAKPERNRSSSRSRSIPDRNSYGRITVRHKGGGNRRKFRIIDFKRDKTDAPGTVLRLEYDPNRSANIALIEYPDGERRYIVAPVGLNKGDTISHRPTAPISSPATRCPYRPSPSARSSIISSCIPARARSLSAAPARPRS